MTDDLRIKAPDVDAAFERASKPPKKELEKPEPKLEHKPPGRVLTPMGEESVVQPQVSPQLREEDTKAAKMRALVASMLARREFNRAARDAWER